jgi:hypothetical protein
MLLFGSERGFLSDSFGFGRHGALCFGHHKEIERKPNDRDTEMLTYCRARA